MLYMFTWHKDTSQQRQQQQRFEMDIVIIFQVVLLVVYIYHHHKDHVHHELSMWYLLASNQNFRKDIIDCFWSNVIHHHNDDETFIERQARIQREVCEIRRRYRL